MGKNAEIIAEAIHLARKGWSKHTIYNLLTELDEVSVKVWRESDSVKLPTYAKPGDACMDVYVHSVECKDDGRIIYHTGLHFKLPEDYEMEIRPRSSISKTMETLLNGPGTLDSGYTGELMIVHRNRLTPNEKPDSTWYNVGDRVAQIIIRHRENVIWEEVDTVDALGETERGDGGFGHTGK